MQDIVVAAVQMNAPLGEVERNRAAVVRWSVEAARQGAELVCFPELAITGHWCAGASWDAAEEVPAGPTTRAVAEVAGDLGITIAFGIGERENGVAYNTYVVVGPAGCVGKQRKLHPSSDEYFFYRPGTRIPVLDIGKCRLGIGICFDNMFPEVARVAAVKGAEVFLMPHAARCGQWPADADAQRKVVARAKAVHVKYFANRAFDNGMYLVDCNQAGPAGPNTNHAGGVLIFDPNGDVMAQSQTEVIEDEMVLATLHAEAYNARRREACFNLRTRRPEVYGDLCRPSE